jgi:hypothetical protein
MTTTSSTVLTSATSTVSTRPQPVWRHGAAAAVLASVTTPALAAIASTAGISFADRTGERLPISGFAVLTLFFSLVGVAIAAVLVRTVRRPRPTFVWTAVVLTALSFVPDLTFGFDAGSAATLITLHVVAALIVVPAIARRLPSAR